VLSERNDGEEKVHASWNGKALELNQFSRMCSSRRRVTERQWMFSWA
jgi:hypothetical protein